jgi:integrase
MRAYNEGSIYQRKDGRWLAAVTGLKNGKIIQIFRYAASEEEARRKLTDLKHRQDMHEPIHFDRESVGGWLETWLETFIKPHRKPKTWSSYDQVIHTYVLPAIGKKPLASVAELPELIQAMLNYQVEIGHKRTAELTRVILHVAFKRAVKFKRIAWNPIDALETIRVVPKEMEIFNPDQAETFLKSVENHRLEGLFWVAIGMGLRKGELGGLSLDDIDLENATIQVRETIQRIKLPNEEKSRIVEGAPKSQMSKRKLPLPDFVIAALRRHLDRREQERLLAGSAWKETGRLFTNTIGKALDLDKLTRVFHQLTDETNVPRIRFHDLRHTCGTFLHGRHVDLFLIQEILGHSQLSTTRRYVHPNTAHHKEALG